MLFLDEFPEFRKDAIEAMRQPLEDGVFTVSRVAGSATFPSSCMLVASMNPCPCGYYNHPTKQCECPPGAVKKYLNRISGPLLDRIDLQVEILPVPFDDIASAATGETSEAIRERVVRARQIQAERFANEPGVHCNAQMSSRLLKTHAILSEECLSILRDAMTRLDMSARAYDRILKVARTIADLDASEQILPLHMREAVSYRNLDRGSWGATTADKSLPFLK